MSSFSWIILIGAVGAVAVAVASPADVIHLNNGNALEGEIIKETEEEVKLKTPVGTISLKREAIARIERKIPPLELYRQSAGRLEDDDSAGHYVLGLWCKKNGLRKQAEIEFEKTIAANPNHAEAHKELGHVMHGGKWVTKDEAMRAKGFVKHDGRWVTRQEAEGLERSERQGEWLKKLKRAAGWLCGSRRDDGREVFEAISVGDDPAAVVPALSSIAGHECALAREEAIKALARIRTPDAFDAIIEAVLNEDDQELIELTAGRLKALNPKRAAKLLTDVLRDLRRSLTGASNDRKPGIVRAIRTASQVLGMLDEPMAVPELARSLVLRVNYIQDIDSTTDVAGPVQSSTRTIGPVRIRGGRVDIDTIISSGVSISTSVKDTRLIPTYLNKDGVLALNRLTGQRHDFNSRKWLEWWAIHKPVFPPEEQEFELN